MVVVCILLQLFFKNNLIWQIYIVDNVMWFKQTQIQIFPTLINNGKSFCWDEQSPT